MYLLLKFILIIYLFKSIYNNNNCDMKIHNFYLLPLEKEEVNETNSLVGLRKFDYMLILKPYPKNIDKYQIVLNVSFPININIELSNKIIYDFISLEKFCINDLETSDKYINILGTLQEYETENLILERVWIKVEQTYFFKEIEIEGLKNQMHFYLLSNFSEFDNKNKEYILMKKMNNDDNQVFQIVTVKMGKDNLQYKNNYVCDTYSEKKYELTVGNILKFLNSDTNTEFFRDNFVYNIYYDDKRYEIQIMKNLVCITYNKDKYDGKC